MKIHIGWIAKAMSDSALVFKRVPKTAVGKQVGSRRAAEMLVRFNALTGEEKIAFLVAAHDLAWFAKSVTSDIGVVDIDIESRS